MWTSLKQFFTASTFSEPDQVLATRWLKITLAILSLALIGLMGTFVSGVVPEALFAPLLVVDCIGLGINVGCWLLVRKGLVRLSAFLLVITFFFLTAYANLAIFRSIYSPVAFVFFTLIPLANLLLGKRGMILVALYSIVVLVMTFYLERTGTATLPITSERTWGELFVPLATIILTTVMVNAVMRRLEENAEAIQQNAKALATTNHQLQISQVQLQQAQLLLEDRVRQRTADLKEANQQLEKEAAERQRSVEALRASEAQWRSLVENVPEVIVTLDPSGIIHFANRPINQHEPVTLIGSPANVLHSETQVQEQLQHALAQVSQTGKAISYESEETTAQGMRWQVNRLGAIQEDGQVTALILIATDITEQRQTQAAMYQSQKLESLGLLAGGVAHDFNNLFTAMLLQLSAALRKLPEDHDVCSNLQKTMKATEHAAELTRQMLNYAGRMPAERKPVDLNELVADNIHLFSVAIAKNVKLLAELADKLPLVQGDKSQFQQLLMNLILNGTDAIGRHNGTVLVKTTLYQLSADESQYGRWTGDTLPAGCYVKVEVQDTGCGMDENTMSRIFDPFFTTKFTGRGLGLASVLGIVRAHKGGLAVTSTMGKGTTFSLLFPIVQTPIQVPDPLSVSAPVSLPTGLVLVIEDEAEVREATATILREAGLEVVTAPDGPPGIQLFRERANEIRLVLLDLAMPEMNGAAVLQELKAINPAIPVILVSGFDEDAVKDRLLTEGLATFLQKPYTTNTLLQQIQAQLLSNGLQQHAAAHSHQ